jgi:hypothetical protein
MHIGNPPIQAGQAGHRELVDRRRECTDTPERHTGKSPVQAGVGRRANGLMDARKKRDS